MKTEKLMTIKKTEGCLNFKHLMIFIASSILSLNTYSFSVKNKIVRKPSSILEEEVITSPMEQKAFIQTLFAEDDAGVMKSVRESLNSWERTEEYARNWNLSSTGLYKTPSTTQKKSYISKNILRYADKRLAGEVKNAEEGSTLHNVGKVEKSLRPNASVPVSKYISLKFKARVLQGKAIVDVKNPWIDCNATISANGKMRVLTKKDFEQLGTSTGAEYNVNDSQLVAFVDQEVTKNVKARISTTSKEDGSAFSNDAEKKLEMTASFPFNL